MNECKVVKSFQLLIQLFHLYSGQMSWTAPPQRDSQSQDTLHLFLNNFSPTDNAETALTQNTKSLFGSKIVKEKNPRNCLELLKHLKPAKTVDHKTKSPELMKYLAPIRQNKILRTSTFR